MNWGILLMLILLTVVVFVVLPEALSNTHVAGDLVEIKNPTPTFNITGYKINDTNGNGGWDT